MPERTREERPTDTEIELPTVHTWGQHLSGILVSRFESTDPVDGSVRAMRGALAP